MRSVGRFLRSRPGIAEGHRYRDLQRGARLLAVLLAWVPSMVAGRSRPDQGNLSLFFLQIRQEIREKLSR
jgi:hypothetical protein